MVINEEAPEHIDESDRRDHKRSQSSYLGCVPLAPVYLQDAIPFDTVDSDGLPSGLDLSEAEVNLSPEQLLRLKALIREYIDIFSNKRMPPASTKMEMNIEVEEGTVPHAANLRRYNPATRLIIVDYVKKFLREGVLEESVSDWNSNVVLISKPDGSHRVCIDYRKLNSSTVNVSSQLPKIQDCLDVLGKATIWTALDAKSGYYSLGLAKESRKYTAFYCPSIGSVQFTRASMGMKSSQQGFCRLMHKMLEGYIYEFCAVYSDDCNVYSSDVDKHIDVHLRKIFSRFREFQLKVKGDKAIFCTKSLMWCGHKITEEGITADPAKISAIVGQKNPTDQRELRSLLGGANFLRKFIPRFAEVVAPLRPLLCKAGFRKNQKLTEAQKSSLQDLRDKLVSAPVLAHPNWDVPFEIYADCSPSSIGACLMQMDSDGNRRAISYLSKSLNTAQMNYAQHEREALSLLYAVETWRSYIFGSRTTVYTDSKAVEFLIKPTSKYSGRLLRWLIRFSEFDVDVLHRRGVDHCLPDSLSRLETTGTSEQPKTLPESLNTAIRSTDHLCVMTRASKRKLKRPNVEKQGGENQGSTDHTDNKTTNAKNMTIAEEVINSQPCKSTGAENLAELLGDARRVRMKGNSTHDDIISRTEEHEDDFPWKALYCETDYDMDALRLRPDLTLFSQVNDIPALIMTRQAKDDKCIVLVEKLFSSQCLDGCVGAIHVDKCLRRHWSISSDGLLMKISGWKNPQKINAQSIVKITELKKHTCVCPWQDHLESCPHQSYSITQMHNRVDRLHKRTRRVVIPKSLITSVLYHFHGSVLSGHLGRTKSTQKIHHRFYWKGMHKDVSRWVAGCLPCRRRKTPRPQNCVLPGKLSVFGYPMEIIHIDWSGPYPISSNSSRWVLSIYCPFSKWPICVALPSRKASLVAQALMEHVLQHYTSPRYLVVDGGQELIGKTVGIFCSIFGIRRIQTPPYTPSMNVFVEKWHSTLASGMTLLCNRFKTNWHLCLPIIAMSYRIAVNTTTGFSPIHVLQGREPRMPMDQDFDTPVKCHSQSEYVSELQSAMKALHVDINTKALARSQANMELRFCKYRKIKFEINDEVLLWSPQAAELMPLGWPRKQKLMAVWSERGTVVALGEREDHYIVLNHKGKMVDVRADGMIKYTTFTDGKPSVNSRPRLTLQERKILSKDKNAHIPQALAKGLMCCFPLTMRDGSDGFGIAKILNPLLNDRWDGQWFSNTFDDLDGPFEPCWIPVGKPLAWYTGNKRGLTDQPLRVSSYYQGDITQSIVACVGFNLSATGGLPASVREHMHKHPKFKWKDETLEDKTASLPTQLKR